MREHQIRPENIRTRQASENSSTNTFNAFTKAEKSASTSIEGSNQASHPLQMKSKEEKQPVQAKFENFISPLSNREIPRHETQKKQNKTGLPDSLKGGVEHLSGVDLSDVKVHYNSAKPSEINALAYAQGNNIHLSSGEEKHLPHEAWHVVQQRQGRVSPTLQMKPNIQINDEPALEREADQMGAKAARIDPKNARGKNEDNESKHIMNHPVAIQRMVNLNILNSKEKPLYEALVLKVQKHNIDYPGYQIQIDRFNNQSVTTLQQLIKAVNTGIFTAAEKAEAAKKANEAEKSSTVNSKPDHSKPVAFESKKIREVEKPAKPQAEKSKPAKELSDIEKMQIDINNSIGSAKPKMQQREDFNVSISNQILQTLVANTKPANVAVTMGGYSKVTADTVYFPITIVETISPLKTNTYDFEIHYHPTKTGNWLHAKKSAGSIADAQIASANHWMIDLPKLQAGRSAWNFACTDTAPTLP